MRNFILTTACVAVMGMPGVSAAQERPAMPAAVLFPGSIGGSMGTLAPTEPGNLISQISLEQGFTPWHHGSLFVVGFARVALGKDTQNLAWNNRAPGMVGVKVVKVMSTSVLQVNVGAAAASTTTEGNSLKRAAYATYWAGWRGARGGDTEGIRPDAFPGSFSAASGFVTPLEPNNWISSASLEQGMTLVTVARSSFIPFTRLAGGADSERLGWNNRLSVEGGAKVRHAIPGGIIDLGVSQRYQYDRITQTGRTAPVAFAELWIGWNPRASIR